jgi:hypothetical protein
MKNFNELFLNRTYCKIFQAFSHTMDSQSWMGGNAPQYFDDKLEKVNGNGIDYYFYLSLMHPFENERMISIFVPKKYDEYLDNNIYPNCSIQVFEHPVSEESIHNHFTNFGFKRHSIVLDKIIKDSESFDQPFLIKLGGTPRLIQDEDYYFTELKKHKFDFLLQIDEDGYPDSFLDDTDYPFGYGALYLFAHLSDSSSELNPIAGFWQYS